ncbi:MAG TPA: class I SAM-dependent methyltransferase [Solirubrobacterales bacterium]|nr:class I SAM-dependent methyltransferase [Solirubrobacterales bacterium]
MDAGTHWERIYAGTSPSAVSWSEPTARTSLELIEEAGVGRDAPLIDVGGGASPLAGELLAQGYTDITVTDISASALEVSRAQLGERAARVTWIEADVLDHDLDRTFALWHDRAFFHFMVDPVAREAYLAAMRRGLAPDGQLVIATFGPEGPTSCSGLPVRRYGAEDLARLLPDFESASSRLVLHHTPSGRDQQFLYARFAPR